MIKVIFGDSGLNFVDHGGYESRNPSTIKMIRDAWAKYPPTSPVSKEIVIWTEDGFNPYTDFSYAIEGPHQLQQSVPHFMFESWQEVGIQNYMDTFDAMVRAGEQPPSDNRVFWIGANTNPLRVSCCDMAKHYSNMMDFRMMSWNRTNPSKLFEHTHTYVSLEDHCKYRVLVDLGAGGFSARLPLLLASGRPVILASRKYESWFYWDGTMKPWVHYIPGGSTPESIHRAVKWTFENPDKAREIGRAGQEYAKQHLTYDAALKRYAKLLWQA